MLSEFDIFSINRIVHFRGVSHGNKMGHSKCWKDLPGLCQRSRLPSCLRTQGDDVSEVYENLCWSNGWELAINYTFQTHL